MKILKILFIIIILIFWFFGTYLFALGANLRVRAEIADPFTSVNLYKKILTGLYPLKSEARVGLLDKLFFLLRISPNLKDDPVFLEIFSFAVEQAEKENPNNLQATLQLVQAYALGGKAEKSIFFMNRAVALSPKKQTSLWIIFNILQNFGAEEEAKKTLHYLNEISPTFINSVLK